MMPDGAWSLLGWLCVILVVLQYAAGVWAIVLLRRKSVPELWGFDWLDILVRLERDCGVTFTRADFEAIPRDQRFGLTAGQLCELVDAKLRTSGQPVPEGAWDRVVAALVEALNVAPVKVRPDSRLYADLGMSDDTC